jgi:cephalosporin-C deacetylase-like acetyl esterase
MNETVHGIEFNSNGKLCRGFHYLPQSDNLKKGDAAPCVVMAHGFGGTIEMGLRPYAEKFSEAGMHVLLFDYRHFGISDGVPRQLISVRRQQEDYISAITFARRLEVVDAERIALFGTSFSGGHVVEVSARDNRVAVVVSQCPMMDRFAAFKEYISYAGISAVVRLTMIGIYDLMRGAMGMEPCRLPVVGEPETSAFMSTPDALPGWPLHRRITATKSAPVSALLWDSTVRD